MQSIASRHKSRLNHSRIRQWKPSHKTHLQELWWMRQHFQQQVCQQYFRMVATSVTRRLDSVVRFPPSCQHYLGPEAKTLKTQNMGVSHCTRKNNTFCERDFAKSTHNTLRTRTTSSPSARAVAHTILVRDFAKGTTRFSDSHCTKCTFSEVHHPYHLILHSCPETNH